MDVSKRYRLREPLGSGGLATVHEAEDVRTGEIVAVKRLNVPRDRPNWAALAQRMTAEAKILRLCAHPRVLRVLDWGKWGPTKDAVPAIVMERCVSSLYQRARTTMLPIEEALDYAIRIADALSLVHERGCIHLDVKPSNILIGADGDIRLADFGAAYHPAFRATSSRKRGGTPQYAPPEDAKGPRAGVTPAHDTFSLGILVLAVSSHRKAPALLTPILREVTLASYPDEVAAILGQATHPDPSSRFLRMSDMHIALVRAREALARG